MRRHKYAKLRVYVCRRLFRHKITNHDWQVYCGILAKTEHEALEKFNQKPDILQTCAGLARSGYKLQRTQVDTFSKSRNDKKVSMLFIRSEPFIIF